MGAQWKAKGKAENADAKGRLFTKLAKEIMMAARGGADPAMNARLRLAVDAAKKQSMPRETLERAIKKAIGGDGENYDEIRYEGYGPGGTALIVEVMTDNRNRTAADVRSYFTKAGGNMAETGAVSFMFDRCGLIVYDAKAASEDDMLEAAVDGGADDVQTTDESHEIYCDQNVLQEVAKALEAKFGEPKSAKLIWRPQNTIAVNDEQGEKVIKLVETLEDHDDVQNVYSNFEVSDALMAKLAG